MNWRTDQDYLNYVSDLLATEEVLSLEQFTHHHVTNRLAHSIDVSYRSYRLAKQWGLDARAVARAGLLHDLFFYDSQAKNDVGGRGHNYEHPRIAVQNARQLTKLNSLEEDIIIKHMFGATAALPKYKESYLVSLVDKQCAIIEVSRGIKEYLQSTWQDCYMQLRHRLKFIA